MSILGIQSNPDNMTLNSTTLDYMKFVRLSHFRLAQYDYNACYTTVFKPDLSFIMRTSDGTHNKDLL